jgi:hypothetical protein
VVNIGDHFVECFDFLFWNASIYECNALSFVCLFFFFFWLLEPCIGLLKTDGKGNHILGLKKRKKTTERAAMIFV